MSLAEEAHEIEERISLNHQPVKRYPLIEDMAGQARDFAENFILNMNASSLLYNMGSSPDKIYLLEGEPGTGKTMSTNAIYNTINNLYFSEILMQRREEEICAEDALSLFKFDYNIGENSSAYINLNSRILQKFFDKIGIMSRFGKPTMILLDECDALLTSRKSSLQCHSEDRKVLETLMKNLQIAHDTPDLYIVLTTNLVEECDSASIRAGRIDKKIRFELPDYSQRVSAFKTGIKTRNSKANYEIIPRFNPRNLAELSKGFNYADIMQSIDYAIRTRALDYISKDKNKGINLPKITQRNLEEAVKNHHIHFVDKKEKRKIGFF